MAHFNVGIRYGMPIEIGEKASNCEIGTDGEVLENNGTNIKISKKYEVACQ